MLSSLPGKFKCNKLLMGYFFTYVINKRNQITSQISTANFKYKSKYNEFFLYLICIISKQDQMLLQKWIWDW